MNEFEFLKRNEKSSEYKLINQFSVYYETIPDPKMKSKYNDYIFNYKSYVYDSTYSFLAFDTHPNADVHRYKLFPTNYHDYEFDKSKYVEKSFVYLLNKLATNENDMAINSKSFKINIPFTLVPNQGRYFSRFTTSNRLIVKKDYDSSLSLNKILNEYKNYCKDYFDYPPKYLERVVTRNEIELKEYEQEAFRQTKADMNHVSSKTRSTIRGVYKVKEDYGLKNGIFTMTDTEIQNINYFTKRIKEIEFMQMPLAEYNKESGELDQRFVRFKQDPLNAHIKDTFEYVWNRKNSKLVEDLVEVPLNISCFDADNPTYLHVAAELYTMNIINTLRLVYKVAVYHIELVWGVDKFGMLYLLRTGRFYIDKPSHQKTLEEELSQEEVTSSNMNNFEWQEEVDQDIEEKQYIRDFTKKLQSEWDEGYTVKVEGVEARKRGFIMNMSRAQDQLKQKRNDETEKAFKQLRPTARTDINSYIEQYYSPTKSKNTSPNKNV